MEPQRILQEANSVACDATLLTETTYSSQPPEQTTRDAFSHSSRTRLEEDCMQGLQDVWGCSLEEDAIMQDISHGLPPLFPDDDQVRSGAERVLEAPLSRDDGAVDYMSLEVDELQALQNVMERTNSTTACNTNDKDPYSKYGYPFENWEDIKTTFFENGRLEDTSPFDEDSIVKIDVSALEDLRRIDGLMDTKEMLEEMDEMTWEEQPGVKDWTGALEDE